MRQITTGISTTAVFFAIIIQTNNISLPYLGTIFVGDHLIKMFSRTVLYNTDHRRVKAWLILLYYYT